MGKAVMLLAIIAVLAISGCGKEAGESKPVAVENDKGEATSRLNSYYSEMDYTCRADSDCAVKDIGNCCGTYPQCVNSNAKADPALVGELCRQEGAASVCGFVEIAGCKCSNRRCVPS